MSTIAWLADKLSRRQVKQHTTHHLNSLAQEPMRASQRTVRELLATLRSEPGPKVCLGETMWGEAVFVSLFFFVGALGGLPRGARSGERVGGGGAMGDIIEKMAPVWSA